MASRAKAETEAEAKAELGAEAETAQRQHRLLLSPSSVLFDDDNGDEDEGDVAVVPGAVGDDDVSGLLW